MLPVACKVPPEMKETLAGMRICHAHVVHQQVHADVQIQVNLAKIMLQQGQPVRIPEKERTVLCSIGQFCWPAALCWPAPCLGSWAAAEVATLAELEAALCLAEQRSVLLSAAGCRLAARANSSFQRMPEE